MLFIMQAVPINKKIQDYLLFKTNILAYFLESISVNFC